MRIFEVTDRTPLLMDRLLEVWERSVKATHLFLSDSDITEIKKYVPQALAGIAHLVVAEREESLPVGFMGVEKHQLAMLFLSPEERGKGLGKRLLRYGMET